MKKKNNLFYILLFVSLLGLAFVLADKSFQNDTFYTIKVGEIISKYGVDMKDHFSIIPNLVYTYPHALFDLIIYNIYHLFGFFGIYMSVILTSYCLFLTMFFTTNSIIKDKGVSYLITLLGAVSLNSYLAARAHLVSYIILILILFFIEKLRDTGKKRYILFMIIPALLLTNMHAAMYPVLFVLFIPFLFNDLISYIKNKNIDKINSYKSRKKLTNSRIEIEEAKNTKLLLIAMLVIFIVGFISLTPDAYTYIFKIRQDNSMSYILEHFPSDVKNTTIAFIILGFFGFILLLSNMKVKLRDLLLFGGLFLLTLMSRRSAALFYILIIFTMGRTIKMLFDKRSIDVMLGFNNSVLFVILFLLTTISGFAVFKYKLNNVKYIDDARYPVEMTKYIKENIDTNKMRLFNDYDYGSYLLFNDIKVFIDSRCDLYNNAFNKGINAFDEYMDIENNYKITFNKHKITHVIVYNNKYLNYILELDNNYIKLKEDKYFTLYERVL